MVWKGAIAIVSKFFLGRNLVSPSSHDICCQKECLAQLISHCRMHDYLRSVNDFSESTASVEGILEGCVGVHTSQWWHGFEWVDRVQKQLAKISCNCWSIGGLYGNIASDDNRPEVSAPYSCIIILASAHGKKLLIYFSLNSSVFVLSFKFSSLDFMPKVFHGSETTALCRIFGSFCLRLFARKWEIHLASLVKVCRCCRFAGEKFFMCSAI